MMDIGRDICVIWSILFDLDARGFPIKRFLGEGP
jgi:hypothetical protein